MNVSQQHYERVARYLDGETVELTDAERELAAEIRHDLDTLAARADVAVPEESLDRATRRMQAALAGQRRLRVGRVAAIAAIAAAAAAVVLGVISIQSLLQTQPIRDPTPTYIPTAVLQDAIEPQDSEFDLELALIAEVLRQEQAEFAGFMQSGKPIVLDGGMQHIQEELDTFWLDEQSDDTANFEQLLIESGQS